MCHIVNFATARVLASRGAVAGEKRFALQIVLPEKEQLPAPRACRRPRGRRTGGRDTLHARFSRPSCSSAGSRRPSSTDARWRSCCRVGSGAGNNVRRAGYGPLCPEHGTLACAARRLPARFSDVPAISAALAARARRCVVRPRRPCARPRPCGPRGHLRHRLRAPAALRRHQNTHLAGGLPSGADRPRRRSDAAASERHRGAARRRRQRRGDRPVRLVRRPVGLLRLFLRRARRGAQLSARTICRTPARTSSASIWRRGRSSSSPTASSRPTPAAATGTSRTRSTRRPASTGWATASSTSARARCRAAGSPSPRTATASGRRRGITAPTLQLYVMDEDGKNVTPIAPMSVSSALHPTILRDGRLMFSSHERPGPARPAPVGDLGDPARRPRLGAGDLARSAAAQAFHFMTQLGNGDLVVEDYYNLNNNGFGALYRFPVSPPAGTPRFGSWNPDLNPPIDQTVEAGYSYPFQMSFTPHGMFSITPFTHGQDEAAPVGAGGVRVGKFTHPSAAPANDLLVVWTPGPANDLNRPTPLPYYDAGIYLDSRRQPDRRARRARAAQEQSGLQRGLAARRRAVRRGARRRRSRSTCPGCRTTARCTSSCRPARRSASSAARASTSGRASPGSCRRGTTSSTASTLSTPTRTSSRRTGSGRAPMPASTPTPTSGRSASWRWRRTPTSRTARTRASTSTTTPASGCGSWARFRCARPTRRRQPILDPGRQSGHELPGEDPGRHAVHLPDARPARARAQHGADLASGAAGRGAAELRRLPRAQPAAARVREHGGGGAGLPGPRPRGDDAAADARRRRATPA